jgi:hypothetical protein
MLISRASGREDFIKKLEKYSNEPEKILEDKIKDWKDLAVLLRPIVDTEGWKQVLRPFLELHGNPAKLFKLMREGKASEPEGIYLAAKAEAYNNLLKMVDLFMEALKASEGE